MQCNNLRLVLGLGLVRVSSSVRARIRVSDMVRVSIRTSWVGRSKKRWDDGTDDGTLSRPRICKPLYGPSQDDETGDWTDDGIGLLHVIRLRYSIFIGGQTSTLSLKRDDEPHNDGQLNVSHRLSRRMNNATGQCPVVRPSHVDNDGTVARGISTSRCPVVCPVMPSLFRPTELGGELCRISLLPASNLHSSQKRVFIGYIYRKGG